MSVRNTFRALPTMFQVGFAEAVAYRAEMFVWILSTTMPLVMLALWSAVAREAPVGRFGPTAFTSYFLATFIVRQLTSAWTAWEMNFEVRQGTLSQKLLRPVHPLLAYAVNNIAALPSRIIISIPVAIIGWLAVGRDEIASTPAQWGMSFMAVAGAWMISFLANSLIGCFSFFMESSIKVMDLYITSFFVFSGYLIPIELFPERLKAVAEVLPFRYHIGFPVEMITGAYTVETALPMFLKQWAWIAGLFLAVTVAWSRGVRRFAAFGG